MLEHGLSGPVLGVAWDGIGYGADGTIWGGEFLYCDRGEFERVGYFEPFKLIGGEVAIKEIWRIAYSILRDKIGNKVNEISLFEPYKDKLSILEKAHEKSINAPLCSSVGRLFDAVAFLVTGLGQVSYDGESGLLIEQLYDSTCKDFYTFEIEDGTIKSGDLLVSMFGDNPEKIVTKFINGLVICITKQSKIHNLPIVVGGGVFQNKTLLNRLLVECSKESIPLYFPQKIPPNDGGIAFGQLSKYILKQ